MSVLTWDNEGQKFFEGGVSKCVLFPMSNGVYETGVAWSGISGIDESPEGGDLTEIWADNISYTKIRGAEKFGLTINAYMYPIEFEECDGSKRPADGVIFNQQPRKKFGLAYRTEIGSDDVASYTKGYKIHLVYDCTTSPTDKNYETLNDSPDVESFSWTASATAVPVETAGFKPVAHLVIDSLTADPDKLTAFEGIIYGTAGSDSRMLSPDQVIAHFASV